MGMIAEPNKLDHDAKGIVLTCAASVQEEVPRKNGVKAPPSTMVQIQHAQQTPKVCSFSLKANPMILFQQKTKNFERAVNINPDTR